MKKTILYAAAAIGTVVAVVIVGCGAEQQYAAATSYNAAAPDTAATPDTATPYVPVSTVKVVSAGTGAAGGGSYPAGATVTISAGTLANIHQFKEWTTESDSVTFADAESSTTTFIMPANSVTVTANFQYNGACDYVVIGGMTWMRKNLNVETLSGSWCYEDKPDSCKKYGRLYDWETAMTVCPGGWHLPTKEEWDALAMAAGGYERGGNALKATRGWIFYYGDQYNITTDDYGFSALPGGYRRYYPDGGRYYFEGGYNGYWWTATPAGRPVVDDDFFWWPYYGHIHYYDYAVEWGYGGVHHQRAGLSVRCVKDTR
jgi:uncharacterized protein (TIGR02145 family)